MRMIVAKIRILIGVAGDRIAFAWLGATGKHAGQRIMLFIVMAEVLRSLILPMSAIVSHRSPGSLERKQAQHKKHENAFHG